MDALAPFLPEEAAHLARQAQIVRTGGEAQRIAWRIRGEGPPLVLLHGGHGSWMHWLRNIPALSQRYMLVVPDLPGFGDSDPLEVMAGDALCDRLEAGIDELNLPPRFHLGGFSFGCIPACYMLPGIGPRLHRLFLIGSGGFGHFNPIQGLRRWQETPPGVERDAINRHNLAALMFHDPARIDETAVRAQGINAERTQQNMRPIAIGADQRIPLAAHPLPLTVIWGTEDVLARGLFDERIAFLSSLTPPAEVELLPGVGHWAQYEDAESVNAIILAAMSRDLEEAR